MKKLWFSLLCYAMLTLLLTGCFSGTRQADKEVKNKPQESIQDAQTVKIGILPDVDSIPFIAADVKGYFKDSKVNVELVPFQNPVERDAALQSQAIDGEVADILAAAFAVQNGFEVKITSITTGKYDVLVAPNSGINDISQIKGKKIAISKNTIIEYVTDQMLSSNGVSPDDVEKVVISQMPVRLEMLKSRKVDAACLPEPLASLAVKSGAKTLLTTKNTALAPGIMLFSEKALKEKSEDIKKVYEVYKRITSDINKNPDSFRDILTTAHFPDEVIESFEFPKYHDLIVPSKEDVNQVLEWLQARDLIKKQLKYDDLVDDRFLVNNPE